MDECTISIIANSYQDILLVIVFTYENFNGSPKETYTVHVLNFLTPKWLFVCVEVLRPSQPNGVSLPNHTFTVQA